MTQTVVSEKGQITIPKVLRDRLGVLPGTVLGVAFSPSGREAAGLVGDSWRGYRRRGGPRTCVVADFLIAAHAIVHADRLLTRDRGFYRTLFPRLTVMDPAAA